MGVLDDMTKGITERKAKAAGPSLTPVGTEASPVQPSRGIPDVPEVYLSNEAVADIAKDLRTQAATLVAVADGLDKLTATPTHTPPDLKAAAQAAAKAAEQKADAKAEAKFAADFAAKQQAAQASVYTALDESIANDEPAPRKGDGWACPEHGTKSIANLTSKRGRAYRACKICEKFER